MCMINCCVYLLSLLLLCNLVSSFQILLALYQHVREQDGEPYRRKKNVSISPLIHKVIDVTWQVNQGCSN